MKREKYNELKAGDVLHCRSRGFVARGIQLFTKSRINHTAMVIELYGKKYIIDSQRDGTNPRPIEEWLNKFSYQFSVHRPVQDIDIDAVQERALSMSGHSPYDFASLLIYQPIYILFGKWKGRREEKAERRMYCSEFVAWVYEYEKWWKLSPAEFKSQMDEDPRFEEFLGSTEEDE